MKWRCNSNVVFISWIGFRKANLPLKMAAWVTKKWLKKKKLPPPHANPWDCPDQAEFWTLWLRGRSGTQPWLEQVNRTPQTYMTMKPREEPSWPSSSRKVQTGRIRQSIFTIISATLLKCPNWMSYKLVPISIPSTSSVGRPAPLFWWMKHAS